MSVRYYDEALVNKIKKWVRDPNLMVLKPDETTRLFSTLADVKNDKPLQLPIIAISRARDISIDSVKKQPRTFDGFTLKQNKKVSMPINVVPLTIRYQIDVYTRFIDEADEYIRNLVFNFINYPNIKIELPYNDCDIEHQSTIYLDQTITDNSDIQEHMFADQFTRFTLNITIPDAYLFSLPIVDNTTLEYDIEVKDN